MDNLQLYRKRYIPDETNHLKQDNLLYASDSYIVTSWNALKPRADISRGISVYCMAQGWKISKIFDHSGRLAYWYIDLIHPEVLPEEGRIIFHDLLIDVLIYPDGHITLTDLDELAEAMERRLIPDSFITEALRGTDTLLKAIRSGGIRQYQAMAEQYES